MRWPLRILMALITITLMLSFNFGLPHHVGAAPSTAPAAVQGPINLALNKPATQSSTATGGAAGLAVDGNTNGNFFAGSVSHTLLDNQAWWQVDLTTVGLKLHTDINRLAAKRFAWNFLNHCIVLDTISFFRGNVQRELVAF